MRKTYRFDEVFNLEMGKTPSRDNKDYWEPGEYAWVSIRDLNQGKYVTETKEKISKKAVVETGIKCVKANTVLMSFKLSIGKVSITRSDLFTNEAIMAFNTKTHFEIAPDFLYYYLQGFDWGLGNRAVMGVTLNKSSLSAYKITIPSVEVQARIISELDTLNDIITKKKQQLEELDKLAQATYFNEFGDLKRNDKLWEFHLLKDVCTYIVDCPHSTPTKSLFPTNYPCIRTSELKKGQIVWKSMQYVCESEYDKRIARLKPRQGDIVYGREGSYGDAVCLPAGFDFCLGQRTMLLRPNSKIVDGVFLLYTLLNDFVYDQAKKKNSGSTVGHVNVADIKKFRIPLPPIEKQQKFVGYIATIESQKANIQQSLSDTQQLFDYTMNKYFGS